MWTDELIEQLKALWAEGLTTGDIGKKLGISKNAVVGKAHRLGLKGRPSPIKREASGSDSTSPETPAAKPRAKAKAVEPKKIKSLVDLSAHTCRWPIGDPKEPNFHFCGANAMAGKPYCAEHAAIAYVGSNRSVPKQAPEETAA